MDHFHRALECHLRIVAPSFVAGCVWRRAGAGPWRCVEADPILHNQVQGRTAEAVRALIEQRGWSWSWLPEDRP